MKNLLITIGAIVLLSCNSTKTAKADYEVNKNETFEISLKSNPTTGYSWKWVKEAPSKIVDSVSSRYNQDKAESNMVGVGGNEIWIFKGKNSGVDTLKFAYQRSWEPNSAVETKKIIVKVN